jgi:WD40-like Beta Propeller Repeat
MNFPTPGIKSISPDSMLAGQPAFTLTVYGSSLTPSSTVLWNGLPRATLFGSTTVLTAQITASDIQNAGTAKVSVTTPTPGGGTTTTLQFTIIGAPSSVPQINSLSPSGATTGSGGFTLTVTGVNFVAQSIVTVNGSNRPTSFGDSTTLEASISASDIANAGVLQISVTNPQPNGGSSNDFPLNVKNTVPSVTALTPASFAAGSAATNLGLTGTGYVPTSIVTINGAPRTTTFDSSSALQVALTAGDLALSGIEQVEVVNPAPGGGTSNMVTFSVTPTDLVGLPVIVDIADDGTQANNGVCGATCSGGVPTLTTAGPSANQTGNLVAFASNSTNLLATLKNGLSAIFIRNTCLVATTVPSSGCTPSIAQISVGVGGAAADGPSSEPTLDGEGAHVAYTSTASNLEDYVAVPGGTRQVYWQATCSSATTSGGCSSATTATAVVVSMAPDGATPGNGDSYSPVISSDGQYIAFISLATNLVLNVTADGVTPQAYIRNTCNAIPPVEPNAACVPTTYLVSTLDGTTPGNAASSHPAISESGLYVAFASSATNLGATAPNPSGANEIFFRSTCVTSLGSATNTCVPLTTLASTPDGTTPADGASIDAAISNDGRFIAFASTATNLVTGVGPTQQVYVRDVCTGATSIPACVDSTQLISTPNGTTPANGLSESPSINECGTTTTCITGQYIAFASQATNLGANIANGVENIFVRDDCDVLPNTETTVCLPYTILASQPGGSSPPPADGSSVVPSITGDGHAVSFISFADNLVPHDTNGLEDVFLAGANLIFNLTVTLQGTGTGTVTDSTTQINCRQTAATSTTPLTQSGTCTAMYPSGTFVSLTATATPGKNSAGVFQGWGGTATTASDAACSVTTGNTTNGTCTFTEVQNNTLTAKFR